MRRALKSSFGKVGRCWHHARVSTSIQAQGLAGSFQGLDFQKKVSYSMQSLRPLSSKEAAFFETKKFL